ncbi:endonuclease VII domain-containing protein [Actinoplanes utahensis]|uniref:endonuclease VII domain-containing protein n=1 Tax=Actinoplanes utahensis TaxID=1869 RepID=UPI0009FDE5DC|nr:endonuclease VII domain-containing protein [Actinoplanes utahensis]
MRPRIRTKRRTVGHSSLNGHAAGSEGPQSRVVPERHRCCPDCGETKASAEFPRSRNDTGGRGRYCKPCRNARGNETRQRLSGGNRECHPRQRYGIGQAEVDALLAEQGDVCAICGAADPQHVDHDHRTGGVRGILCFNCNGGLGQFRDDPVLLAGAITYLKGTTWRRALIHPGVYRISSPARGRPPSRSS